MEIYQRFECISTEVRLDLELSAGLEWLGFAGHRGQVMGSGTNLSLFIGQLNANERLKIQLMLQSSESGDEAVRVYARSAESTQAGEHGFRDFQVRILDSPCPPKLRIERTGPNLRIGWSPAVDGWLLESRATIGVGSAWIPVAGQPARDGSLIVVPIPSAVGGEYYRLRRDSSVRTGRAD